MGDVMRTCSHCGQEIKQGNPPYYLNQNTWELYVSGRAIRFTKVEFKMFEFLLQNIGKYLSDERLYMYLWGDRLNPPEVISTKVHIYRLRKKTKGTGFSIHTVYKLGYCLNFEDPSV